MQPLHFLLESEYRKYFKAGILVLTAYFFLGISEGAFLSFHSSQDAAINFAFTLLCVFSNWWLFKKLHRLSSSIPRSWKIMGPVIQVMALVLYTYVLNWIYIELLWQEALKNTAFFPVVLPMAILLFMGWVLGYPLLSGIAAKEPLNAKIKAFEVKRGRQTEFYPMEDTLGFLVENKLVFLLGKDGHRLMIDRSLSDLETELKGFGYFRLNRQMLVNREAIKSFQTVENERIKLTFIEGAAVPGACHVSRYKAPAFRQWLNG